MKFLNLLTIFIIKTTIIIISVFLPKQKQIVNK